MSGRHKWSELKEKTLSKATHKSGFKFNDIVRIKKYPKGDINERGRVDGFHPDGRVLVVNGNMPFSGTISDYFRPEELKLLWREGDS